MKLSNLTKNTKAVITSIECNEELKKRFYSFGITKGAYILVEATSLNKNTIEVNVEDTSIALRIDEADTIEVEAL